MAAIRKCLEILFVRAQLGQALPHGLDSVHAGKNQPVVFIKILQRRIQRLEAARLADFDERNFKHRRAHASAVPRRAHRPGGARGLPRREPLSAHASMIQAFSVHGQIGRARTARSADKLQLADLLHVQDFFHFGDHESELRLSLPPRIRFVLRQCFQFLANVLNLAFGQTKFRAHRSLPRLTCSGWSQLCPRRCSRGPGSPSA